MRARSARNTFLTLRCFVCSSTPLAASVASGGALPAGTGGKKSKPARRRGVSGLKARDPGRRDTTAKVLKYRRSPRRRGRTGTGVRRTRLRPLVRPIAPRRDVWIREPRGVPKLVRRVRRVQAVVVREQVDEQVAPGEVHRGGGVRGVRVAAAPRPPLLLLLLRRAPRPLLLLVRLHRLDGDDVEVHQVPKDERDAVDVEDDDERMLRVRLVRVVAAAGSGGAPWVELNGVSWS
eukprot:30921-Pelagococcus_subviridis.AAC.13